MKWLFPPLAALLLLLAACGQDSLPATSEAAPAEVVQLPPVKPAAVASASTLVTAYLRVTDLKGAPLAGINPIVTAQPNAFDKPLAVGALTGADGAGTVQFLSDRTLFVRAWDPELSWFPNNFYEIPANAGNVARDMVISMVAASALEAQFLLADGTPAGQQVVRLMLSHPQWGPWWPAQAQTDGAGSVRFANVPPGAYALRFEVESGAHAAVDTAMLPPAETLVLGPLMLQ
ncbi:MAG: hypothetical protein HYV26_19100 [Candidatus Hydrogenedentes bacterium]|nr:hypothetical protein [Candidatus Hydrogenedentota bacterium]